MIRSRWVALTAVALLVLAGGAIIHSKFIRWKRFDIVDAGKLYRSGLLKEWQLRQAIDDYGIKTVYSLTYSSNDEYEQVCADKGVRRHFHYLPGDGVGPDDPYLRFLDVVTNPDNQPVLVHCSAGVQRTGGAVALYRTVVQGWEFDAAVEEMIDKGNEGRDTQIKQLRSLYTRLTGREDKSVRDMARRLEAATLR